MAKIDYPAASPYVNTPQTSWCMGPLVYRRIPPNAGDVQITLETRHEYRPEFLSQERYGTPIYWWVFMNRNMDLIRDPIFDMTVGLTIWVPSLSYLKSIVG